MYIYTYVYVYIYICIYNHYHPQIFLQAAKHVEHLCDAIDLNLGCPQRVAHTGLYIYICIYVYTYVYIYICIYICIHMYKYIFMFIYMYVCEHLCDAIDLNLGCPQRVAHTGVVCFVYM
jgi:dihydroorotate dehydrogenase